MGLTPADFVSLHNHTTYSLLDGLNHIKDLVARAKELGMPALGITDHGMMCGVLEFARECKKQEIKPIIGVEAYMAHDTVQEKITPENPTDHLVLLAMNQRGYENISRMLSIAQTPPYFYRKPRLDLDLLAQYSEGVICSSACINGPLARHICAPEFKRRVGRNYEQVKWDVDVQKAIEIGGKLAEIFPDRFFVEVMDHTMEDTSHMSPECVHHGEEAVLMERAFIDNATTIAKAIGVPMIATNDAHFLDASQHAAHDVLLQINSFRDVKSGKAQGGMRSGLSSLYLKGFEEMQQLWTPNGERDDLLTNTKYIADMCDFEFETGVFRFPEIDLKQYADHDALLRRLVAEGFKTRYPEATEEHKSRVRYELEIIKKIGVAQYFLVVADFCSWARQRGILVGPGRGSGGGSIVVYCLGITDLCPIRHNLLFERFMNPERVSMPDLDIDFEPSRRHEVIDYVRQKYGRDNVAAIATFQSIKTRSAIKKAGEVFGIESGELNELTKKLPQDQGDFRVDLTELREENEDLKAFVSVNPDERNALLDICEAIDKTKSAISGHAAGIVIADKNIQDYVPTMVGSRERKAQDWDAPRFTQVSMDDLEDIGLLKYDFLVIDYLDVIRLCTEYIALNQGHHHEFPAEKDESYDDPKIYDLVCSGRTLGVFQIESDGMRRICLRLAPRNFEDLYAILALHRPGPMDYVSPETGLTMEAEYIERKFGRVPITYPHESFEPILNWTYGIMVYQEQLTSVAQTFCGYTYGQADKIRKATAKKKPELVAEEKEKFIPAALEQGHPEDLAHAVWNQIETFGRYGFNKSHSAGYGKLTYQTAYLKAYYPVEYMAALLTVDGEDSKQVKKYVRDCMTQSILVLAPDINKSGAGALPEGENVRFGLRSIAGLKSATDKLVEIRNAGGPFKDLPDLVKRVHSTLRQVDVEKLIQSGCCDDWGSRLGLLTALKDLYKAHKQQAKKQVKTVPLFDVSDTVDVTDAGEMRAADREAMEIELLAGCYREDVEPGQNVETHRIRVIAWDWDMARQVTDLSKRYPGRVPLFVTLPSKNRHYITMRIGMVQNTKRIRNELTKIGCEVRE